MANFPAMKIETILDRTVTIRASVHEVDSRWRSRSPGGDGHSVSCAICGRPSSRADGAAGAARLLRRDVLLNFSLDNLSLMALTIAVGFVVDDAIVVVENIYRTSSTACRRSRRRSRLARDRLHGGVDQLLADRGVHSLLLMGGIIGRLFASSP